MTPRDKLVILAAASRRPRLDERILGTAMITTMAQTADRVDDLSNTFYHMMKVNTDIQDDYSDVPLLSFRTDISKTCKGDWLAAARLLAMQCCLPFSHFMLCTLYVSWARPADACTFELTRLRRAPADGSLLHHPVTHHVDPDQCCLARCGELRVYQTSERPGKVVSMLRAALEEGDTAYQRISLFSTSGEPPADSQRADSSHKAQLSRIHTNALADAGFITEKNTHLWRNHVESFLALKQ